MGQVLSDCAVRADAASTERRLRTAVMQLRQALRPYAAKHDPHAASTEHLYAYATMQETEALP